MERDNRLFTFIALSLVLGIAVTAAVLWYGSTITSAPEPRTATAPRATPIPTAPRPPPQTTAVPAADTGSTEMDALVRALAARLSDHPALVSFLAPEDLLRHLVAAVDAVASGYSPSEELAFMRPRRPFVVRQDEAEGLVIAAGSFRRYDLATAVFASLDSGAMVAVFQRLSDRLEDIHRQLSWSDETFEETLHRAIDHLLVVTVPSSQLAVERRTLTYAFADDGLEGLSGAQRQLLRMGPVNARRVQTKLRELSAAFGWPLPSPSVPGATIAHLTPPIDPNPPLATVMTETPTAGNEEAAPAVIP